MKDRRWTMAVSAAIVVMAATWGMRDSRAQAPPGFKRVELQKHDLATPGREALLARGEFQPGAGVPKHTHPGDEVGYVLSGEVTIEIDGKPALKLRTGETFFVPAGQVHAAKNSGKTSAIVLSTYIVEKDKPLATPVK